MPPQMGSNHGACDMMPGRSARRAVVSSAALSAKGAAGKPSQAAARTADKRKRGSRSRKAAAAGATTPAVGHTLASSSRLKREGGADEDHAAAEVRLRLAAMHARFGGELGFLVTEFTKMEAHLSPTVGNATPAGGGDESSPQQQLARLRFFIEHVKRTLDKMEQAKRGLHHYTSQQLDMLEDHITQRLLPVKARMLAQLALQQQQSPSSPAVAPEAPSTAAAAATTTIASSGSGGLFLGGMGGKDDATAVSDGWVVGTPTPPPPISDDGAAAGGGVGGCSALNLTSGTTTSLPRACSSLSFADLGELCGDQEGATDICGGVFLVSGDDCDDVNGSGIGLDLYDLGQGKESFLADREHRFGRWPSISTLSSASATTDGELTDDSVSVDADSTPRKPPSSAVASGVAAAESPSAATSATATATEVKTEPSPAAAGAGLAGSSAAAASVVVAAAAAEGGKVDAGEGGGVKSGIDQEMGELSELFAPDAFLQSTVLDTEMEAAGAGVAAARAAVSAIEISIEPTVAEPAVSRGSVAAGVAGATTPVVVKEEQPPLSPATVATVTPVASPAAAAETASVASSASAAGSRKEECRCGQAACPSLLTAARKRPMGELSSSAAAGGGTAGAPLSLGTGMSYAGLSSRQRKRQRSLAPVLSAPRTVSYECALCKESYPSEISSNPWWSLFLHECPRCHRMQIPRVDAASAAVSVDYIHAVCAEEGEGYDSDGYGSDSGSDSEDDGPDDGREGLGAFDTDIIAGDSQAGCKEARLSTLQASRLLVLMSHARTCPGRHANPQHADVCRSTKFLMLHMRDCNGYGPNGEPCEHRWCRPCKSLLSHLVRCASPSTCRICTPLDLPGPLRQLRELNVAQARQAAAAAAAAAAATAAVTTSSPAPATAATAPGGGVAKVAATAPAVVDARCTSVVKEETVLLPAATPVAASATMPTPTSFQQQLQQQVAVGEAVAPR